MTDIVAVDIGGTHARFAIAEIGGGRVLGLSDPLILRIADHASLRSAWDTFAAAYDAVPAAAGIAVAAPVEGDALKLTNNPWVIRPAQFGQSLGLERFTLVNDFGAVAHAVAQLGSSHFRHLCGPDVPLPGEGVVSVVGPGTGIGVAQLFRAGGSYSVIETEGGHIDFAPLDTIEDAILAHLRKRYRRVSVERVASGPGLANILGAVAAIEGKSVPASDDRRLWEAALAGEDNLAAAALGRLCLALGAFAGDMALAHGAGGVVIAGGLGLRLADTLPLSGFRDRFIAKGRFERRMDAMPVKLIAHAEPGLFGAAAAFAAEHGD